MRSAAIFMILAVNTVAALCFGSGESANKGTWLSEEIKVLNKKTRLQLVCSALAGNGKKKWQAQEARSFCMQENDGRKWDFMLKYINSGTRTIDYKECMSGMGKEAYGCERGGHTAYWNWEYKADPNAGYCMDYASTS